MFCALLSFGRTACECDMWCAIATCTRQSPLVSIFAWKTRIDDSVILAPPSPYRKKTCPLLFSQMHTHTSTCKRRTWYDLVTCSQKYISFLFLSLVWHLRPWITKEKPRCIDTEWFRIDTGMGCIFLAFAQYSIMVNRKIVHLCERVSLSPTWSMQDVQVLSGPMRLQPKDPKDDFLLLGTSTLLFTCATLSRNHFLGTIFLSTDIIYFPHLLHHWRFGQLGEQPTKHKLKPFFSAWSKKKKKIRRRILHPILFLLLLLPPAVVVIKKLSLWPNTAARSTEPPRLKNWKRRGGGRDRAKL